MNLYCRATLHRLLWPTVPTSSPVGIFLQPPSQACLLAATSCEILSCRLKLKKFSDELWYLCTVDPNAGTVGGFSQWVPLGKIEWAEFCDYQAYSYGQLTTLLWRKFYGVFKEAHHCNGLTFSSQEALKKLGQKHRSTCQRRGVSLSSLFLVPPKIAMHTDHLSDVVIVVRRWTRRT